MPNITDLEKFIQLTLKSIEQYGKLSENKLDKFRMDNQEKNPIIISTILNTPLYRLYAETNKFETLNMIKPIKLKQRKYFDNEEKEKKINHNIKVVRESMKYAAYLREESRKFKEENTKYYNAKNKEISANIQRLKNEFNDIRVQRNAEYANYCIFIYSK